MPSIKNGSNDIKACLSPCMIPKKKVNKACKMPIYEDR